ncbi:hypothetical protein Ae406Ps2_1918 [Pseudonocardia sp. Ae406_Ps2]|nr:hypothetical protein Ae406Ps2_1918 [Pseudonocardia sp. Ae406_Ps2]OLM06295.1 hypothetical protein Ae331Ps2_4005c [Pseudonocardia sp. Ae331_Ps2]OLM13035.1 hypothetical protein Ae505Ps2_3163c [Pseudonocardia sp. Ae505_Ps2]OLM23494.1 hypothetical protein Ae706Ps2_1927 [Pseudonocardia sp. Ae706_Ps2]
MGRGCVRTHPAAGPSGGRLLAPDRVSRSNHAVMRTLLEPFWPGRRIVAFDELCRWAA